MTAIDIQKHLDVVSFYKKNGYFLAFTRFENLSPLDNDKKFEDREFVTEFIVDKQCVRKSINKYDCVLSKVYLDDTITPVESLEHSAFGTEFTDPDYKLKKHGFFSTKSNLLTEDVCKDIIDLSDGYRNFLIGGNRNLVVWFDDSDRIINTKPISSINLRKLEHQLQSGVCKDPVSLISIKNRPITDIVYNHQDRYGEIQNIFYDHNDNMSAYMFRLEEGSLPKQPEIKI